MVHLYDHRYQGCTSSFSCKRIGGESYGRCGMRDELSPILDHAAQADILILGSPLYFHTETGEMRSFMERLLFPYLTYTPDHASIFPRKILTALLYTMNVTEQDMSACYQDTSVAASRGASWPASSGPARSSRARTLTSSTTTPSTCPRRGTQTSKPDGVGTYSRRIANGPTNWGQGSPRRRDSPPRFQLVQSAPSLVGRRGRPQDSSGAGHVYHQDRCRLVGGRPMQDKCENCGHEGLIDARGGTVAFGVKGPDGTVAPKFISGFESRRCPVCGLTVPPWDLMQQVAADPTVTSVDLDPVTYPDMTMDPPTLQNHVQIARYGTGLWNRCRADREDIRPNLRGVFLKDAKLEFANLEGADLAGSILCGSDLRRANLIGADLSGANLSEACPMAISVPGIGVTTGLMKTERTNMSGANLSGADLTGANLTNADLTGANLHAAKLHGCRLAGANFAGADLSEAELVVANMTGANLTGADCRGAKLTGCRVYGVSTWGLRLEEAEQSSLVITPEDEPEISVDGIDIAQFIYLLLSNQKIRDVIDSVTSKAVLVLGRFSPERKAILEAIRGHLRDSGYVPIIFDFDGPQSQDVGEMVLTLALLSGMVICDITDPRSVPGELQAIVPHRKIPTATLIQKDQEPYGMLAGLRGYPWLLPTYTYQDINDVVTVLRERVLPDAKTKADELSAEREL